MFICISIFNLDQNNFPRTFLFIFATHVNASNHRLSYSVCREIQHELQKGSADKLQAMQLDQMAHQLRDSSLGIGFHHRIEKVEQRYVCCYDPAVYDHTY